MHADVAGAFGAWWLRRFWSGSGKQRLLVTTEALRKALERSTRIQFPDACVRIAPNGVDLERYLVLPQPAEARKQLRLADALTVGFTGHFYPGRGIDLLFELAQALPNVKFLWVGGTPEAVEPWRRKLDAAHLTNVTMTGFVENSRLPLFQAASDILVMPYGREVAASSGQDIADVINPMKMFEYMAAGRPIITADLAPIREVLDDSTAVFCPVGDAAAWRRAILALANDSDRRARLGLNARDAVLQHTWRARAEAAVQGMDGE
jgi:glycosyltransferase involved in cell wall biosynthesis